MPCDGIAVLSAKVPLNLSDHLLTEDGQQALLDYLKQAGVTRPLLNGVFRTWPSAVTYVLIAGVTLRFDKRGITLQGSRQQVEREDIVRLFNAAQGYASLINQQQILTALTQMGFAPQEFSYTNDGELSFAIEIGA